MNLEERIDDALRDRPHGTEWESLLSLFAADQEAFYLLACDGLRNGAAPQNHGLASLAASVRKAITNSYEIRDSNGSASLAIYSGETVPVPIQLKSQVAEFLRRIDGKTVGATAGKDFEGTAISEVEARFRLGDRREWDRDRQKVIAIRAAQPAVWRVSEQDLSHLRNEPPFITHELLECGSQDGSCTSPRLPWLKSGAKGGPPKINDGWAALRQASLHRSQRRLTASGGPAEWCMQCSPTRMALCLTGTGSGRIQATKVARWMMQFGLRGYRTSWTGSSLLSCAMSCAQEHSIRLSQAIQARAIASSVICRMSLLIRRESTLI